MSAAKKKTKLMRILIPVGVLIMAVGLTIWLIKTRPSPEKRSPSRSVIRVDTLKAKKGTHQIIIQAQGSVRPHRVVALQPEVTGLVVWKNSNLIEGGIVKKNDQLLRIDRRNYNVAVEQARASLKQAQVEYELEKSRKLVAEEEWKLLGDGNPSDRRRESLALREPQLKATRSAVKAASNLLAKARLDLERTTIRAPFDAIVLEDNVDCGQLVSPQTVLAKLAGSDTFLVEASLPVSKLEYLEWPDRNGEGGSPVEIERDQGERGNLQFSGRVVRVQGTLTNPGRLAQLLVSVKDPLNLKGENPKKRLFSGSYVSCLMAGRELRDTFEFPSSVVRADNQIWVLGSENQLEIRDANILWRQGGKVFLSGSVRDGERIVSSEIAVPLPGMKLMEKGASEKGVPKPGKRVAE